MFDRSWSQALKLNMDTKSSSTAVVGWKSPLGMRRVSALEQSSSVQRMVEGNNNNNNNNNTGGGGSSGKKIATKTKEELAREQLQNNKAMGIATGPGKQIMMNGFMMYMSGNTLNIFSISITSMAIMTPIQSIFGVTKTFAPYPNSSMPQLVYLILNLVWLAIGLYKMKSMNLLPVTSADWNGRILWKHILEQTSIPPL